MNKVSLGLTERLEAGTNAFFYGQLAGDNVALIQGFFEVLGGGTVAAAGTGLSVGSGGVLSVVGAPAAAGGIALAGHGAAMFGQGVKNILKAEGPGNGGSGNFKRISSNSRANKVAKRLGYDDAHALKEEYVGKGEVSRFDMYVNSASGEVRLVKKSDSSIIVEIYETLD